MPEKDHGSHILADMEAGLAEVHRGPHQPLPGWRHRPIKISTKDRDGRGGVGLVCPLRQVTL